MKFSSFLIFTAAGLAIAAPITPISPANVEKKLTVEPVEVYKRQIPDTSAVTGLLGNTAPIKRQIPDTSAVTGLLGKTAPIKRQIPDTSAVTGLLGKTAPIKRQLDAVTGLVPGASSDKGEKDIEPKLPASAGDDEDEDDEFASLIPEEAAPVSDSATTAVEGAPVSKRQLGGLVPSTSSDDGAEDETDSSDPADPKEPKEPKEPSSVSGIVDETKDSNSTKSATSKIPIGGLPIGKRADLPTLPATDSLPALSGLGKRQIPPGLMALLGGDKATPAPAAPANATATEPAAETPSETPAADDADAAVAAATPAPEPAAGGLGGILKRQLNGLLGGDKDTPEPAAEPVAEDTEVPAADDTADDVAAAATPAAEPASGLGGILKRQESSSFSSSTTGAEDSDAAPSSSDDDEATPSIPIIGSIPSLGKRQLNGVLGGLGAPKDDPAAPTAEEQASFAPDDGTNEPDTKFSADEDESAEEPAAAPAAKNATEPAAPAPAAEKPAGGLGGLLGM